MNGWTKWMMSVVGIVFAAGLIVACVRSNAVSVDDHEKRIARNERDIAVLMSIKDDVTVIKKAVLENARNR